MFERLEHVQDDLPRLTQMKVRFGRIVRVPNRGSQCRALLLSLLLLILPVSLRRAFARLPYITEALNLPLGRGPRAVLAHFLAFVIAHRIIGPVIQSVSALLLRAARAKRLRWAEQAIKFNGLLLKEERIMCAIVYTWAIHLCCGRKDQDNMCSLLMRPRMALLLLMITSSLRKLLEFAFLTSKLRARFKSAVLTNTFERAVLQRLAELPEEDERIGRLLEVLQMRAVLPDIEEPHSFEHYTADMLRTAYGRRKHNSGGGFQPSFLRRAPGSCELQAASDSLCASDNEDEGNSSQGGSMIPDHLRRLLNASTTMFLMQVEGRYNEIEDEARLLFRRLMSVQNESASCHEEARCRLRLCHLEQVMPKQDSWRSWQLFLMYASADGSVDLAQGGLLEQEFVSVVRHTFERFHTLAATVKDYAAIVLVFSSVLRTAHFFMAGLILFGVFFNAEIIRTISISISTTLLGLSFVFGGLLREIFESLVLILLVHPYDVGDRIRVTEGDDNRVYTVQKINILTTEVRDLYNQCVYLKNSSLFHEAKLINLGRSLNAVVELGFGLPASQVTPATVEKLNNFVRQFIAEEAETWVPAYFRSFTPVNNGVLGCDISGSVQHRFRLMHRKPWQDFRDIRQDATTLLHTLLEEMQQLKLDFRLTPLPIQIESCEKEEREWTSLDNKSPMGSQCSTDQANRMSAKSSQCSTDQVEAKVLRRDKSKKHGGDDTGRVSTKAARRHTFHGSAWFQEAEVATPDAVKVNCHDYADMC